MKADFGALRWFANCLAARMRDAKTQDMTIGLADNWLERRAYPDLPAEAERALRAAALCWHEEGTAEAHLARAKHLAGDHVAVLIGNYRYLLYKHRFAEAREAAGECLAVAAARLGIAADFRAVAAHHADFAGAGEDVRFWLFTLQAFGYVCLRAGRSDEGQAALEHLASLDTADQTKTRLLLQVIARATRPEE